jgi:hypothetical protein
MSATALDDYDDEETVAKELKVTKRTLRKWRGQGTGPPYVKIARVFYYPRVGRVAWIKSQEVRPVRAASHRASNKHQEMI